MPLVYVNQDGTDQTVAKQQDKLLGHCSVRKFQPKILAGIESLALPSLGGKGFKPLVWDGCASRSPTRASTRQSQV
ncbi:MAG: hypothetical protein BJG00_012785 [Limnothrix sp. CACIAM 69d]|nr:MAG: hypothetical protein BJG00_012785 [Limnothrix sp. CACIAM 69d]